MQLAKPRRNTGKDVWLWTMRATELRDVADQAGKTLSVQVDAGVDLVASPWAEKREWLHGAEHPSFADATQVDEILFEGEDVEIYLFGRHMRRKAHPVQSDAAREGRVMTADRLSHVTEQLDGLDPIAMLCRALRQ